MCGLCAGAFQLSNNGCIFEVQRLLLLFTPCLAFPKETMLAIMDTLVTIHMHVAQTPP